MDAKTLTEERKNAHGNWLEQSRVARELRNVIDVYGESLAPYQREALDMIAVKMSRVLCGDPAHEDHWDDIAGYAYLGKGGHGK